MSQKFTRVPEDTFEKLQLNAGILVSNFDPATGSIAEADLMGATTGGIQFATNPTYTDFGEDIDNVPNNMKELKHLEQVDPTMSGTFLTCTPALARSLAGAADIDVQNSIHIIPRADLIASDFESVWWIGDYSDVNTGENAGFLAIHLINALNTAGFQIQSEKNNKGKLAFEYHGHYSIEDQDTVPYEIYVKSGSDEPEPAIALNKHYAEILTTGSVTLTAVTTPAGKTVTWSSGSDSVATVSNGVVAGAGAGNTIITASATIDGVTVTDTCTVVVTAPAGA